MPMLSDYRNRLFPDLPKIAESFGTPFHIYDEIGIRRTGERLKRALSGVDHFKEYFAVKALPNPRILSIMRELGFGFDCSSIAELMLARQVGARGEEIMFTSNCRTSSTRSCPRPLFPWTRHQRQRWLTMWKLSG